MSRNRVAEPRHLRLGRSAERMAVATLQSRGLTLVETNWHCTSGEIDAVMWDADELVFVEVKARTGAARGSAEEALTASKARKLMTTAEWFLDEHPELGDPIWRIDLVAITLDREGQILRLTHIANAAQIG